MDTPGSFTARELYPLSSGLLRRRWHDRLDYSSAEAAITLVSDSVLARSHSALRVIEHNSGCTVRSRLENGALVYLPVTYLDRASEWCGSRLTEPVNNASCEC